MPDAILTMKPLGFAWETLDPFLFCVHHDDAYPKGNARLGPDASLLGRNIGQDFEPSDGWRMYHGQEVPGFPQHPHRGFETVTLVRKGYIDHSDSLGAVARFGKGDAQWLTAGAGIVHAEMFPLLDREQPNPVELFQIWLNLPAEDKLVPPHFSMFWDQDIPEHVASDEDGRKTTVRVVAGSLGEVVPPKPPPHSWAARADTDVAIWTLRMEPGARWTLPPAKAGTNRTLYFFAGSSLKVEGRKIPVRIGVTLRPEVGVSLENGAEPGEMLLLQGRPIGQPVFQHGPFVMNSPEQIQQAFSDFRRTGFGGWPWQENGPTHARTEGHFARHPDGTVEKGRVEKGRKEG